jgi:hypothetical protein
MLCMLCSVAISSGSPQLHDVDPRVGAVHIAGRALPLLWVPQTLRRFCYRAAPVRAAVRTLTLNLYAIESPEVQAFLAGPQSAAYFTDLGAYMTERCQVMRTSIYYTDIGPLLRTGICLEVRLLLRCQAVSRGTTPPTSNCQAAALQQHSWKIELRRSPLAACSHHDNSNGNPAPCPVVQALDKALAALQGGSPLAAREVEALLAEVEALLSYWNDILCTSEWRT